ncbi:MAG TPA: UDP-N-acetylglucosamine 2-epimerase (non-hydrolyzing) [Nitrospira sp.]|nr:UDP-N-acetylglucosamine 2-epimerase (non-hydrolyzing) [Nitrospira sp.]
MKIVTVIGARPQFIKAAAFSRQIREIPGVREVIVHTGQHYDSNMSDVFFEEMDIPRPDHHLGIGSDRHGAQTGRMLAAVEQVLLTEKPDWLLVYGDTNSTLAGALAAAKLHIPVAHVEAGLRSFNRRMPEEVNRVLTDHAADLLFAPTGTAVANLRREGLPEERIRLVGDVMYDAALFYGARAREESRILDRLGLQPDGYVLATIHRAENTDEPARLQAIFSALAKLAGDLRVVVPLHPRTRAVLAAQEKVERLAARVDLVDPVGYLDMTRLEQAARLITTDSGGVQKEAFFHGVPCVTLRGETEWVELVEAGWNRLAPPADADGILRQCRQALAQPKPDSVLLYGAGDASKRIVDDLAAWGRA